MFPDACFGRFENDFCFFDFEFLELAENCLVRLDAEAAAEVGDQWNFELAQIGDVEDFDFFLEAGREPAAIFATDIAVMRAVGANEEFFYSLDLGSVRERSEEGRV